LGARVTVRVRPFYATLLRIRGFEIVVAACSPRWGSTRSAVGPHVLFSSRRSSSASPRVLLFAPAQGIVPFLTKQLLARAPVLHLARSRAKHRRDEAAAEERRLPAQLEMRAVTDGLLPDFSRVRGRSPILGAGSD